MKSITYYFNFFVKEYENYMEKVFFREIPEFEDMKKIP